MFKPLAPLFPDPYVLVNLVSRRVKQLRGGARPLVESLEKLKLEDIALREVAEGKISYELYEAPVEAVPRKWPHARAPAGSRVPGAETARRQRVERVDLNALRSRHPKPAHWRNALHLGSCAS